MSVVVFIFFKTIHHIFTRPALDPVSLSPPSRGQRAQPTRERREPAPRSLPTCPPARLTESALHRYRVRGSVVVFNRYHLLDWDYLLFPKVCWKLLSEKDAEIFQIFFGIAFTYSPRFSMLMWQICWLASDLKQLLFQEQTPLSPYTLFWYSTWIWFAVNVLWRTSHFIMFLSDIISL